MDLGRLFEEVEKWCEERQGCQCIVLEVSECRIALLSPSAQRCWLHYVAYYVGKHGTRLLLEELVPPPPVRTACLTPTPDNTRPPLPYFIQHAPKPCFCWVLVRSLSYFVFVQSRLSRRRHYRAATSEWMEGRKEGSNAKALIRYREHLPEIYRGSRCRHPGLRPASCVLRYKPWTLQSGAGTSARLAPLAFTYLVYPSTLSTENGGIGRGRPPFHFPIPHHRYSKETGA